MSDDKGQPERGCLTCGLEPNWTGGQYNCWKGICRWPGLPDKQNRPSSLLLLPVTKSFLTGQYRAKVNGKEVANCPTWEPKESDNEP